MSISFLGSQAALGGVIIVSRARTMIANASANTKGVYTTSQIGSSSYPTAWLLVTLLRPSTAGDFLVDVGVGSASSEQVIVANLPYSCNITTSPTAASYLIPLLIPDATRVTSRCQCSTGSGQLDAQITLFAPMFGGEIGLGQTETCGAQTGTSLGKTIPGHTTTAHTKGTWTELIASTSFAYRWCCLGITHTNAVGSNSYWAIDLGVGGAGVEVVVVPDLTVAAGNTIDAVANGGKSFPLSIPAGSRLSARCACSVTTASERDIEVVLLGVG